MRIIITTLTTVRNIYSSPGLLSRIWPLPPSPPPPRSRKNPTTTATAATPDVLRGFQIRRCRAEPLQGTVALGADYI